MSQPPEPPESPGPDKPPSWAGAPGFSPHHGPGVPHAPMPGAPPYPAAPPPAPPAAPPRGPGFFRTFKAAAVWAVAYLVLIFVPGGQSPGGIEIGILLLILVLPTVLTALTLRFVARGRAWPFWLLVLVALPVFWILQALQGVIFRVVIS
jgi:hypothetical protein